MAVVFPSHVPHKPRLYKNTNIRLYNSYPYTLHMEEGSLLWAQLPSRSSSLFSRRKSMTHKCFRAKSTAASTHQSPPRLGRSRPGPYGTIERQTNMDNTYARNNIHHLVPSGFFFFFSAGHFASERFLTSSLFTRREQAYSLGQEFQGRCIPNHSCR